MLTTRTRNLRNPSPSGRSFKKKSAFLRGVLTMSGKEPVKRYLLPTHPFVQNVLTLKTGSK